MENPHASATTTRIAIRTGALPRSLDTDPTTPILWPASSRDVAGVYAVVRATRGGTDQASEFAPITDSSWSFS